MSHQKIIVANWKLERRFGEALSWVKNHYKELSELAEKATIALCPDIITTALLRTALEGTDIALGSQSCSPYLLGKHTGAVSALSLCDTGCSYAIIGHSEERARSSLTDYDYAMSCFQCLLVGITPILCIEESCDNQMSCLYDLDKDFLGKIHSESDIYIAYEPTWAIGSGTTVDKEELINRIYSLRQLLRKMPITPSVRFLYGGGITSENCDWLRDIPDLGGLLLGSSSLDMQNLKKIVYSFT